MRIGFGFPNISTASKAHVASVAATSQRRLDTNAQAAATAVLPNAVAARSACGMRRGADSPFCTSLPLT
jgi:hypothetical protein